MTELDIKAKAALIRNALARSSEPKKQPRPGGLLNYSEIGRQLFPVQPMPEGAKLIFFMEDEPEDSGLPDEQG